MGLTTNLGLHSQTTRLCEDGPCNRWHHADGALTLSDDPFQGHLGEGSGRARIFRLQFTRQARDFQVGLFPFRSPLLGESWLVSFPPLIDMLKFSG